MTLKTHTIQAIVTSAIAAQYLNVIEVAVLFASIVLIDVDHYFDFVVVCKRYSIRDMFKFHKYVWEHKYGIYGLNVFHTLEFFAALFFLGFASHYFWIALAGCAMHMILDVISLLQHGIIFNRAFSIIEYFIRKTDPSANGYPVPDPSFWDEP